MSTETLFIQPDGNRLLANIELGPVHLSVGDLGATTIYYRHLGLSVLTASSRQSVLGTAGRPLLVLQAATDQVRRPQAGLFHFALLVPSRRELARTVRNMLDQGIAIGGASDHLVSEAIYLSDPEGNGIEIYRDRPRDEWKRQDGKPVISTLPLDLHALLREAEGASQWQGVHEDTRMGHIHLRVSNLDESERFYRDVIGFDPVSHYGSQAAFLAADGYHHHIGLNTWGGPHVKRRERSLGLAHFEIQLADDDALHSATHRLAAAGADHATDQSGAVHVTDPSGINLLLTAR